MQDIGVLSKCLPSEEDVRRVKRFAVQHAQRKPLSKAERFVLDMGTIPHCERKLRVLEFKCSWRATVQELEKQCSGISRAADELVASGRLRELLATVVAVSNTINAHKAQAQVCSRARGCVLAAAAGCGVVLLTWGDSVLHVLLPTLVLCRA